MLRRLLLILPACAIGGCAAAPALPGLITAADPAASVPTTRYQRVIGPAKTYRAVEPRGWVDDATPGTLEGAAR